MITLIAGRRKLFALAPVFVLLILSLSLATGAKRALAYQELQVSCEYGQGCFASGFVGVGSIMGVATGYDQNGRVIKNQQGGYCSSGPCPFYYQSPQYANIAWSYIEIFSDSYENVNNYGCYGSPSSPQSAPPRAAIGASGGSVTYVPGGVMRVTQAPARPTP